MEQRSDTRRVYEFFGGEQLLVAVAPDDPDAHVNRKGRPTWQFTVVNQQGEELGVRGATAEVAFKGLLGVVWDLLYQTISSSEVDRRRSEIWAWLRRVYKVYETRVETR